MNPIDFWSIQTNPETGAKFEKVLENLKVSHNGNCNVERLISGEYGQEMIRNLLVRFEFEENPMGESVQSYYHSLGLKKEMYESDDYYTRWVLLTPLSMYESPHKGKKYPLIFMNHGGGNSIEADEFSTGLHEIAGKEDFMVAYLQNTNWQNTNRVLDIIADKYPLDSERVYLTGYSQGGYQVTSTYFRIPGRFAAVAPCGNDIYRDYDNFNVPYTEEETENLRQTFLPFMQVNGVYEASCFVPINDWQPRKNWGYNVSGETYLDPRRNDLNDPTRIIGGVRPFSNMPVPPEGTDKHQWMISRLNKRMHILGCENRDPDTCIAYLYTPEDDLHHTLGFYGDKEDISVHFGVKYYFSDIWNKEGIHAFRYVAVENAPHTPPVLMGQLVWDFFKKFRRDHLTGQIVEEE
jgi:pimeloyl-ACP methyl ester carboxylesterase